MAAVLYDNLADAATVRAGTQLVLTPALNVQNEHVARKWRSQIAADYLIVDFGAAVSIDTVAIVGVTATSVRFRLSLSDSSGADGDAHDSGTAAVDQDYGQAILLIGTPVSARYLRIDLVNDDGEYVDAGRLVAGLRSTFQYNFAYGWQRTWVDPSLKAKTRGGQTQLSRETPYRTLDLTFEWVSKADRNSFVEAIDRVNGASTDILIVTDIDSDNPARDSVWGLISETTPVAQPFFQIFSKQYRIEERL